MRSHVQGLGVDEEVCGSGEYAPFQHGAQWHRNILKNHKVHSDMGAVRKFFQGAFVGFICMQAEMKQNLELK